MFSKRSFLPPPELMAAQVKDALAEAVRLDPEALRHKAKAASAKAEADLCRLYAARLGATSMREDPELVRAFEEAETVASDAAKREVLAS